MPCSCSEAARPSIYVSTANGLRTGLHYARVFVDLGQAPIICLESDLSWPQGESIPEGVEVVKLSELTTWQARVTNLHDSMIQQLTSFTIGLNPAYRIDGPFGYIQQAAPVKRVTLSLIRRLPFLPSSRWYNRASRVLGWAAPRRFPSDWVIAVSTARRAIFLNRRRLRVDTLLDGWDHPVRRVAGYWTSSVIAWNSDLGRDWVRFQGADQIVVGAPVRLEYALGSRRPGGSNANSPVLLYPVATSEATPRVFEDELRLIQVVADVCREVGWALVVKPRPEAVPTRLDSLVAGIEHARLGTPLQRAGSPSDFHMTSEYNEARLAELDQTDLVLGTVTTFGLDAAAAGKPLLQLDPRRLEELPAFAEVADNYHLRNYLYSLPGTLTPGDLAELRTSLRRELVSGTSTAELTGKTLRDWVAGRASASSATAALLALGRGRSSSEAGISTRARLTGRRTREYAVEAAHVNAMSTGGTVDDRRALRRSEPRG